MKCIFRGVVLVAISALFVLGCDPVGPSTDERSIDPPVEGLQVTPWEPGESLLPFKPPKRTQDGANSGATDKIRVGVPPSSDWDAAVRTESPYGCVMSTPAQNEPKRYWHEGVYLHFPATLTAGVRQTVDVSTTITSRTIYSDTPREEPVVARVAHCRIPDVAKAREMVSEFLHKFPAREDGSAASGDTREGSTTWRGEPVSETRDSGLADRLDASKEECTERTCTGLVCRGTTGNLSGCRWVDCTCTNTYTDSGGDEAYGGGGGAFGGTMEPSHSSPYLSETLQNYGGFDTPGPGSCTDCSEETEEPADEPVSKAEVVNALIEACDLPPSTGQNEDVMSDIFQASVNASFNASSPSSHAFRTGVHHQDPYELDGFATAAFDMQDGGQLDLLTGIIETKFTEDPSNGISSGQSQRHIRSLYSTYNLIPSGATFTGAPVYAVVTNSQLPVEMIGRYSEGAGQYDLVTYANDRNVNFVHYRVMRTFLGNLKLEGDILGTAQTTRSAIQDFLGDFDVDFVIDCTPAEN